MERTIFDFNMEYPCPECRMDSQNKPMIEVNEDYEGVRCQHFKSKFHVLFFIMTGEMTISYGKFTKKKIEAGQCVFVPFGEAMTVVLDVPTTYIAIRIHKAEISCSRIRLLSIHNLTDKYASHFPILPIKGGMESYLDLILQYFRAGLRCGKIHHIKIQELSLAFRLFYTADELASFFYHMIIQQNSFKDQVLANYSSAESVDELAESLCMSRSAFNQKFRQVFEISPYQWILLQKSKDILHLLFDVDVNIVDVMERTGFKSQSQFTNFCKKNIGLTPKEIKKRAQDGNLPLLPSHQKITEL